VECKAIEREESARCNGPGEVITESLLIILEGKYVYGIFAYIHVERSVVGRAELQAVVNHWRMRIDVCWELS